MKKEQRLKKAAIAKSIRRITTGAMGLLLVTGMHAQTQQKSAFTVSGDIKNLADGELYLGFGTFGTMKADTVSTNGGKFQFKDSLTEPCYAMLFNHDFSVKIDLYLDKGNITVEGNKDSAYDFRVAGSAVVNEYAVYMEAQQGSRKPVQAVYEKWMAAYNSGDSAAADRYKAAFNEARDKQTVLSRDLQLAFIKEHPGSISAAWELLHYIKDENLDESVGYFQKFSPAVQNSVQGKELSGRIGTLSRIKVGHQAPGFAQAAVEGKDIRLADYKGKYVLLEFWASWCGPCRAESPNVLAAYSHFHDKGFNVLSVSLDNDKAKWAEAIQKDGLLWEQVSDLKGWKNDVAVLYGINAVPANFLIDPQGKIIAQNLRGEALQDKLKQLFTEKK